MTAGKPADRFAAGLNKAMALHQQSRLAEAEQLYRQLLRQQPGHFDVVHLLGTLLRRTGDLAESQALLDRAVAMRPQSWAAHYNRGNTLIERRNFTAAAESFSRAIGLKRDHAEAHYGRAVARLELGDAAAARGDAEAALELKPLYPEAALTLAMSYVALDRLEEARQLLLRLLAVRPAWPDALLQLARVFHLQREWARELDALSRALKIDPKRRDIVVQIAVARRELGQTAVALQAVDEVIAAGPHRASAHAVRGEILSDLGRIDEALASFDQAINLDPNAAQAHANRGHTLSEMGRIQEAALSYQRTLEIDPGYAAAHYGFSRIHHYAADDPLIARMRETIQNPRLSGDERSQLFFALAKALDDAGDRHGSFAYLQQGNATRKQALGYRPEEDQQLFGKLAAAAPALMALAGSVMADPAQPVPVFIVGMPRSGTTLIEQILSAGPSVKGAGELNLVKQLGLALATGAEPASPGALGAFAGNYLAGIAPLSGGRPFVADKMPHNFRFLPLICAALPQARIVHVSRDARAVCWSNYQHHFMSRSLGYAYDLGDIVSHYLLYDDLMRRWKTLCGGRIIEVSYERLTVDQEAETRKLIERLSLSWHEAYLAPEANKRLVRTASARQVRQPVYRGSSDAWQAFSAFIGDAFDRLPEPSREGPLVSGSAHGKIQAD
ncbi:MAG: tetratricopeptide repeat-containing sulfotransferase family protein [Aestuariivirga sp.]|uniref:tetratricopeptide repeat-containing sulfotransferase family protein n=1 Tax=Aestuariivirga sp. TaxID=2650926 RepID=UPI0038CF6C61